MIDSANAAGQSSPPATATPGANLQQLKIRIPDDLAQRFDTVLESFAREQKVAIVAEGIPLHPFGAQTPLDTLDPLLPLLSDASVTDGQGALHDPAASRVSVSTRMSSRLRKPLFGRRPPYMGYGS